MDMTPTYRRWDFDRLRVNPRGSVTLLRRVPDYRQFAAVTTWEPDELPRSVRDAIDAGRATAVAKTEALPMFLRLDAARP